MNIFCFDPIHSINAQQHCDKHVVKMIVEYAQLLSTAHHVLDGDMAISNIYKATHINHPCAVWVRESSENYMYLWRLLRELLIEYRHRYGKEHKTELVHLALYVLPRNIPDGYQTEPAQAMPDQYKRSNVYDAYRAYFNGEKQHIAQWTGRKKPHWYRSK